MSLLAGLFDELPDLKGAACTGHPYPELFFPENRNNMARDAKEVCDGCPVRAACRDWARKSREPFGVWGGETEQERAVATTPAGMAPETRDWRCGSLPGYSRHRRDNEKPCVPCREAKSEYDSRRAMERTARRKASA